MNTVNDLNRGLPTIDSSAEEILRYLVENTDGALALASSFSVEDVVLIDIIQKAELPIRIFAIDTGRLSEETYRTAETVQTTYGVEIDWYSPNTDRLQTLIREEGLFSFRQSVDKRRACCHVRKVEPLNRALTGLAGWVTGMRREQSPTRDGVEPIEIDVSHANILKANPICSWSIEQVWNYANEHRIPIHPLHRSGYPSIGCTPCTRAISDGEDERAGRWWWEDAEHKECGLHR